MTTTERRVRMYFTGPEPQPMPTKRKRARRRNSWRLWTPLNMHVWAITNNALCRPIKRLEIPGRILVSGLANSGNNYEVFSAGGEANWTIAIEKKYFIGDRLQVLRYYHWKSRGIVLVIPTEEDRFADVVIPFPERLTKDPAGPGEV